MLAVLGAMGQELAGLRRLLDEPRQLAEDGAAFWQGRLAGKTVLLAKTGIGRRNAEASAALVAGKFKLDGLISLGYSGGLNSSLRLADVVVADVLHYAQASPQYPQKHAEGQMLAHAISVKRRDGAARPVIVGGCVTADHVVAEPAEKRALSLTFGAQIVDMESYWVMGHALACGLPCVTIRSVLDTADEQVPDFDRLLARPRRHRLALQLHLATHWGDMATLIQVYRQARRARQALTDFVSSFIESM